MNFAAEHTHRSDDAQALLGTVIQEVHDRLDRAGVPIVDGLACNDATCNSKLGHRVKLLIAERDHLRARLTDLDEVYERFTGRLSDGEDSVHAEILKRVIEELKKSVVPRSSADPIAQHIDELFRHYGSVDAVIKAVMETNH